MHRSYKVSGLGLLTSHFRLHKSILWFSKIWEPDYLIYAKTKTPEYDIINFHLKGYDFAVLEKFQSCVHKIAKMMDICVNNTYASPHKQLEVHLYKPKSSIVDKKYDLKLFERTVQVIDVKSHIMPLFIEAVLTTCPPGVKINITEHTPEIEEERYIPNLEVVELQKKIEEIGTTKKKKIINKNSL